MQESRYYKSSLSCDHSYNTFNGDTNIVPSHMSQLLRPIYLYPLPMLPIDIASSNIHILLKSKCRECTQPNYPRPIEIQVHPCKPMAILTTNLQQPILATKGSDLATACDPQPTPSTHVADQSPPSCCITSRHLHSHGRSSVIQYTSSKS